jgi:hypothetical protein
MVAFLQLGADAGDGNLVRDHVKHAAHAGSESAQAQLDAATVPAACEHIWGWYWELRASTPEGFSRSPVSFQEIDAWIRCMNLEIRPWEIRALRAMDEALHRYHRDKGKPEKTENA